MFTGGAEVTPEVEVARYYSPDSMNHLAPTLNIKQGNAIVQVSPDTLRAILKWYETDQ